MQTLSTTRTAVLLLAVVIVTAGCGARATRSVGLPTDSSPVTEAPTAPSMTSATTAVVAPDGEQVGSAGPGVTPQISPSTTSPSVAAVPEIAVDDIDSVLEGLDETLAELDQLLNQAAAALAAEEGEIIP